MGSNVHNAHNIIILNYKNEKQIRVNTTGNICFDCYPKFYCWKHRGWVGLDSSNNATNKINSQILKA